MITDQARRRQGQLTALAYFCIIGTLVLVVLLGVGGAVAEIRATESNILKSNVSRLRGQATRRAAHIEAVLNEPANANLQINELPQDEWFQRYWKGASRLQSHQLYAAIVDPRGRIVTHTEPEYVGRSLGRRWYDRVVSEVGNDVVEIRKNTLANDQASFDIRIPLLVGTEEVGGYHEGLSFSSIEQQVAAEHERIVGRWSLVVGANLLGMTVALISLYYLALRSTTLRKAVRMANLQRVTEVGQLAAGLAHEIRNPLHALRLNLHTLRRVTEGKAELAPEEITALTAESQTEIDRVDQLMRELLGFANPEEARNEDIDLREEVAAALDFLNQDMERGRIAVDASLPEAPVIVHMDPNRVRQIMLNLLLNAKEVMRHGGELSVRVLGRGDAAQIVVADNGPGIAPKDRHRIFDPFFSTKSGGTGFGLAIVKRYVTEAGGTVTCGANNGAGTEFEIRLPMVKDSHRKD